MVLRPAEIELPICLKRQNRARQNGTQYPDRGHRMRTTLGALVPKGRPKKIQSFNYMLRLPGLLARVHPTLGLHLGPSRDTASLCPNPF